jgi:predicted dehydrogenase
MLKGAIIGTGFWANYQVPAWQELEGVTIVAAYNRTIVKAQTIAEKFSIRPVYDDVEKMLDTEQPDFVDIITDVDTHHAFTLMAAKKGNDVICQKPMAPSLKQRAKWLRLVKKRVLNFLCMKIFAGKRLSGPLKQTLDSGIIGARVLSSSIVLLGIPGI